MKSTLALLACLAMATVAFAQFELTYHQEAVKLQKTTNGKFVVFWENGAASLDETGTTLANGGSACEYLDVDPIPLPGGSMGALTICIGGGLVLYAFEVLDSNLTPISQHYLPEPISQPVAAMVLDNGALVLAEENKLSANHLMTNAYWEKNLPEPIVSLAQTPGDSILVVLPSRLLLCGNDGDILGEYPEYRFTKMQMIAADGNWAAVSTDSIYLLSPALDKLASLKLPGGEVLDLETGAGKIAVLSAGHEVNYYDLQLNWLGQFALVGANLSTFRSLEMAEDGVIVEGSTLFGQENATFVKKFGWDGTDTYTEHNDVALLGVDLGADITTKHDSLDLFSGHVVHFIKMEVANPVFTVKNQGEAVVNQVTINTFFPTLFLVAGENMEAHWITLNGNQRHVVPTTLAPGETKDIALDKLTYYFENWPNGQTYEQCFWTSRPNGRVDDDPDNDRFCANLATGTAGRPENLRASVSPNPANSQISVSVPNGLASPAIFVLYDVLGKPCFQAVVLAGSGSTVLPTAGLSAGLYYWVLEVGAGQVSGGKLVVAH